MRGQSLYVFRFTQKQVRMLEIGHLNLEVDTMLVNKEIILGP
jgi:hypothetical protein